MPRPLSLPMLLPGLGAGIAGAAVADALFDPSFLARPEVLPVALYGAAVGAALGAGLVIARLLGRRPARRAVPCLLASLLLGPIAGLASAALGQGVFRLLPATYSGRADSDVAIVLDSSGSMAPSLIPLSLGSDPWSRRQEAAKRLIEKLSGGDRLAVVDFDHQATLLFPLQPLTGPEARQAAAEAVDWVDSEGGTNLSAGLGLAVDELLRDRQPDRPQLVVFLTDGQHEEQSGSYDPQPLEQAQGAGIAVFTIGLGSSADAALLRRMAEETGGLYYPVMEADDLIPLFERMLTVSINLVSARPRSAPAGLRLESNALLLWLIRALSWTIAGAALGLILGLCRGRQELNRSTLAGALSGAAAGIGFDAVAYLLPAGLAARLFTFGVLGAAVTGTVQPESAPPAAPARQPQPRLPAPARPPRLPRPLAPRSNPRPPRR